MIKQTLKQNQIPNRPNLSKIQMSKLVKNNELRSDKKQTKLKQKLSKDQQLKRHLFKQCSPKLQGNQLKQSKLVNRNQNKKPQVGQNLAVSNLDQKKQCTKQKINQSIQQIQKNCQKDQKSDDGKICLGGMGKKLNQQNIKKSICKQTVSVRANENKEKTQIKLEKNCQIRKQLNDKKKLKTEANCDKQIKHDQNIQKSKTDKKPSIKSRSTTNLIKNIENKKQIGKQIPKNSSKTQLRSSQGKKLKENPQNKQVQCHEKAKQQLTQLFCQIQNIGKSGCQKNIIIDQINRSQLEPQHKQLEVIPEQTLKKTLKQEEFNTLTKLGKSKEKNLIVKGKKISRSSVDLLNNTASSLGEKLVHKQNKLAENKNKKQLKSDIIQQNIKNKQENLQNKSSIKQDKKFGLNQSRKDDKGLIKGIKQSPSHKRTEAKHPLNDSKSN